MAKKVWDEKINKGTEWGGDESTDNLPVSGNRVQEFIKGSLDSKAGLFHYDMTNNRYIVFADEETQDEYFNDPTKTELIIGTFDAPFNYSAQITLSIPTYVAILSGTKNNYIDFTFDTKNKQGQSVGEDIICTYTFIKAGIKKVVTEKYRYGTSVHFNIDEYISTGTNTITVGIVGQNTLAATTIGITYQVVDLQLSDTYDISQSYNLASNPGATAAIPYQISGYGTKVMEWYLDGVMLDYVKVEDEIVDVSTTRTKYISLANLSQGIHSLQYRAYTMLDGEKFYSNILYRDLIVVTGVNKSPIIGISATIPVGNDILVSGNLQLYGITQYIPYELHFAVYNPSSAASTDASIAIDGKVDATISTHNGEISVYSLRPTEYGVKTMTITAGTTVYTIGLNITKSPTSLEPITDGLQLDMMALGKSNNDVNREEWVYGLYSATFNGFNWNKTSGWNNNRLLITSGAYVDINLAPLSPDPTATGKTLEFEFATANVSDDNAVICDLRNSSGTGLLITASEVILKSAGGAKVSTKFKAEENIRIAFVINRKTGVANKGLVFIYVNGILSGAVNYSSTDNFTSDKTLRIGNSKLADVQLKALRFYTTALNSDQVLDNHILYRDTTEELLSIYDKNNIYEEGTQNFSVDKLSAQCPVFIFTGDIPALENTTDKNKTIYVDVEYINMQEPYKSFTGKGIRLRPQGTSSMGYPKKNFRPYTGYGEVWDNLGNIMINGLYAFKEGSQPVNVWCLKADYAESSGTHNTGIARLWNQVMTNAQVNGEYVLRTEAQKVAIAAGYPYDVRTTVDGFPCHVLYRLTADSELIYIGKYNFNNDKSTESVFGFRDIPGFDNSKMQCWEVLNNGNHLALFQDIDNFDTEWDQAYEARYPDGSTNVTDLKTFCEWVVSTKGNVEKFKSEKWQHLDVYKVAAYYVYLMRFAAVDQVVKNAMITSEDGIHFYYINYDNDTIIGVRNDGLLIYNYDIDRQTIDTSFSALVYAYAGHDSTLWNNCEADDEFMRIVSEIDNALYTAGLTYEKTIDMFDNQQSGKWCERVYNQDAQYKYVGPYTDTGINNLFMLQGSRSAHRRWWLSHRFDLLDSKFVSGAYKAKSIEFKAANAPTGLQFSITSGNKLYYGYGLNNVPVETGVQLAVGASHTFTSKQVINVGDPVRIYSAVNVQELDVHDFTPYLSTINISEVYNSTVGTKLKKLVMGVNTATDERRNTSLTAISGLLQAKRLEYLDISGYQAITDLDLSSHVYLTTLKAFESGLTGVVFVNGAPVSKLELPATLQSLVLDSLPNLSITGLNIANSGKAISYISIRNCDKLQTAKLIFDWNANKTTADGQCTLLVEGLNWSNVDPANLISLGNIKDAGGVLSLKGRIRLITSTQEQINRIREIFGDNCFDKDSELYITAPDAVYITGPSELFGGQSATYIATVFSDYIGEIKYKLLNGGVETNTVNGCTIDETTGVLTTTETTSNRNITVRAKHIPTQGAIVNVDMNVNVKAYVYPSSISIVGTNFINKIGSITYQLGVLPVNVTGDYTTTWEVTGDAVTQGLVEISSQKKTSCILNIKGLNTDETTFTLKATSVSKFRTLTATLEISMYDANVIMTSRSNPEVMAKCYNAGWTASADRMTKDEAEAVTDLGTIFKGSNIKTFNEIQYFINLTTIGDNAFNGCFRLLSIVIPEGVTSIGDSAFTICERLASVTLPSTLTIIGGTAFANCTSLTSIVIPEGVTSIGNVAFNGCTSLTSIVIPEGVTSIGKYSFSDCTKLESITVSKDNNVYADIEGVLFDKGKTTLIIFPPGRTEYVIPEGVTIIGRDAFYKCTNLTSIVIPEGVTSIGDYAFQNCTGLKSVTLPSTLTTTGVRVFLNCSGLTSIVIPEGVTSIGDSSFQACTGLTSVTLPSTLVIIDRYAFYKCTSLTSIVIPEGVTSIGDSAFKNCDGLVSVTLPSTLDTIINNAFYECISLVSIVIPERVTTINNNSFQSCTSLTSIVIPEGVTSIGNNAFYGCTSLESVTLPSALTTIGNSAFNGCTSLTSIVIPEGVTIISSYAFSGCRGLASVVIPEGMSYINTGVFKGCKSLASITLPSTLTNIGANAFEGSGLTSIIIPEGALRIGLDSIQSGNGAFMDCKSLDSVTLPSTLVHIAYETFKGCTALNTIISKRITATTPSGSPFGTSESNYTGRDNYDKGTNKLYVPAGATGYDSGYWLDPLCISEKCGFTISYTL